MAGWVFGANQGSSGDSEGKNGKWLLHGTQPTGLEEIIEPLRLERPIKSRSPTINLCL